MGIFVTQCMVGCCASSLSSSWSVSSQPPLLDPCIIANLELQPVPTSFRLSGSMFQVVITLAEGMPPYVQLGLHRLCSDVVMLSLPLLYPRHILRQAEEHPWLPPCPSPLYRVLSYYLVMSDRYLTG